MKKLLIVVAGFLLAGVAQAAPSTNILQYVQRAVAARQLGHPNDLAASNKALAAKYRKTMFGRFLTYVTYNSQSSYKEEITSGQIETAKKLFEEIKAMGYTDAQLSEHYYLFVRVPSNLPKGQTAPILGFSGHYDVTPEVAATGIKRENLQIIENYRGGPIAIGKNPDGKLEVLDPDTERDAYLKELLGQTIVTADGKTNLGADNRAGLSILMTTLQVLAEHPEKKHGEIQLVIAPNEETGGAGDYIKEVPYRPEIAFDFDGNVKGELMTENYYALQVICDVKGAEGHQGHAVEGSYLNHGRPSSKFVDLVYQDASLPTRFPGNSLIADEPSDIGDWVRLPEYSTGRQGYMDVHITRLQNDTTRVDFRLRSFDKTDLLQLRDFIFETAQSLQARSKTFRDPATGEVRKKLVISCTESFTYDNIRDSAHPASLKIATAAFNAAGVTMRPTYERAGTTGAIFAVHGPNDKPEDIIVGSYMLFTGQNNMHSYAEWLSEKDMYESFLVGLNIVDQVVVQLGTNK